MKSQVNLINESDNKLENLEEKIENIEEHEFRNENGDVTVKIMKKESITTKQKLTEEDFTEIEELKDQMKGVFDGIDDKDIKTEIRKTVLVLQDDKLVPQDQDGLNYITKVTGDTEIEEPVTDLNESPPKKLKISSTYSFDEENEKQVPQGVFIGRYFAQIKEQR